MAGLPILVTVSKCRILYSCTSLRVGHQDIHPYPLYSPWVFFLEIPYWPISCTTDCGSFRDLCPASDWVSLTLKFSLSLALLAYSSNLLIIICLLMFLAFFSCLFSSNWSVFLSYLSLPVSLSRCVTCLASPAFSTDSPVYVFPDQLCKFTTKRFLICSFSTQGIRF